MVSEYLAPTPDDVRRMLRELVSALGSMPAASAYVGVTINRFRDWVKGRTVVSNGSRRAVWLCWVLLFRPELLMGLPYSVISWGWINRHRVRRPREGGGGRPIPPGDWSDWVI